MVNVEEHGEWLVCNEVALRKSHIVSMVAMSNSLIINTVDGKDHLISTSSYQESAALRKTFMTLTDRGIQSWINNS